MATDIAVDQLLRLGNEFCRADYMEFEDVELLETFPFVPNGCVVFVKTFNSWHAVMPYTADPHVLRKSVVINIDYSHAVGAAG